MKTERRGTPRQPLALEAVIFYQSLTLPDCRTRDLSLLGAFVETGGQSLPQNAQVDVAFLLGSPSGLGREYRRFPAQVVRVDEHGVGVMFQYPEYTSFCDLADLFNAPQ